MSARRRYGTDTFDPVLVANLREELEALGLWEVISDPEVTDVMVNETGRVFVASFAGTRRLERPVEPLRLESAIATMASLHGLVVERDHPILEATLPFHAIRVEALVPPVVSAPTLVLRKPATRLLTLEELVARETLSPGEARHLSAAVLDRKTLLIAGGVGSGKTTLASALLHEVVTAHPAERLVILEEGAREIRVEGENVTRLLTSEAAGIGMTRLLRTALRLNPDRIILGEARGAEALDFVKAANTGHPGGLLTLHASSAEEALVRLDVLAQEAGVPSQMERIREVVDLVVFLERSGGERRVVEMREKGA